MADGKSLEQHAKGGLYYTGLLRGFPCADGQKWPSSHIGDIHESCLKLGVDMTAAEQALAILRNSLGDAYAYVQVSDAIEKFLEPGTSGHEETPVPADRNDVLRELFCRQDKILQRVPQARREACSEALDTLDSLLNAAWREADKTELDSDCEQAD